MESKPKDFDKLGLNKSWDDFYKLDPLEISKKAVVKFDNTVNELVVPFYNEKYYIQLPERVVRVHTTQAELNPFFSVIILHYLINAQDLPLGNKLISFRELYGGSVYFDAFYNRAVKSIAANFGNSPELLIKAAEPLDPKEVEKGDCAIEVSVLPKLPLTVITWEGDEEVPGSANILFDSTANKHLPTEDLAAISELLAKKLVAKLKEFI